MRGLGHGWHLAGDARRLARYGVLRPFETHPEVPPLARLGARLLRFGTFAPDTPDYAAGLKSCGPAAIKLGQALATRPDLVGEVAARDLMRLQDDLPPVPWAQMEAVLNAALAGGWRTYFRSIDPVPAGAASIAQVHKAVLLDGTPVAVKILRPGVELQFQGALASYAWAAGYLEQFGREFERLKPRLVIETFRQWTLAELDLRREAGNTSEMAAAVRAEPVLRVPKVHWEATTRRTLVLEWVDGIKLTDMAAVEASGADRKALAVALVRGFLAQAIGAGYFHADMHQGNILLSAPDRLTLIDFGIVGRLDRRARIYLAEILYGLITGNYRRVAEIHFEAGYVPPHHDIGAFATALRAVGEPIRGRTAADISVANLLEGLFAITRQFDMVVQPHLLLLQKTMVTMEGVALTLDPQVNLWEAAEPYVRRWLRDELGPEARLADGLRRKWRTAFQLDRRLAIYADQTPPESAAPPLPPLPPAPNISHVGGFLGLLGAGAIGSGLLALGVALGAWLF